MPAQDFGGCERVTLNLLRHIDKEQFEAHLTTLEPDVMPVEDVRGLAEVHELGTRRARWAALAIAKLCAKLRPHLVFSMSAHLNSAIVASRPLLPSSTAVVLYESADLTSPEQWPGSLRWAVYKRAYKRADLVICQSERMKQDLVRQFGLEPSKVMCIYNPVDISAMTALADAEANPFSGAGPNLVAVGRLAHVKGFDVLLKSLPRVLEAVPNVSMTVVGDGPDSPELSAEQQRLGLQSAVRFVGMRRNPFPFLKHATLVVLPSRSEAFPNVVLEAIALGTPVVTTNCSGALQEIASCTRRLRIARDTSPEGLGDEVIAALSGALAQPRGIEPEFEARFGMRAIIQQYQRAFLRSISTLAPSVAAA